MGGASDINEAAKSRDKKKKPMKLMYKRTQIADDGDEKPTKSKISLDLVIMKKDDLGQEDITLSSRQDQTSLKQDQQPLITDTNQTNYDDMEPLPCKI